MAELNEEEASRSKASQMAEQSFGEPIRVFRAKLLTRAVVALCGVILLGGGVLCFIVGLTAEVGVFVVLLGICVLGLAYLMGMQSCLICPGGVVNVRLGQRQRCAWAEISEMVDARITQGLVSSRICTLRKKNGARMELRDFGIDDFGALLALLREQAKSHGILWKEERSVK